jgi:hypothetical protein
MRRIAPQPIFIRNDRTVCAEWNSNSGYGFKSAWDVSNLGTRIDTAGTEGRPQREARGGTRHVFAHAASVFVRPLLMSQD